MTGRSSREFSCKTDPWPVIDQWALENNFSMQIQEKSRRVYRKGHMLLMAPAFLEIRQEGRKLFLEAWIKADFFLILSLLTGKKAESGIESGGLTAVVPRKRARDAVNRLLNAFGAEPIT